MIEFHLFSLIAVGGFVGAAAGYLGSFMVLKRMSLVGDALSHVALPGMAIALTWHISPLIGAFVALFITVIGIWHLQETSTVYPDALVGIFFTAALSIGILITPEPELLEALFGNLEKITSLESIAAILCSALLILITSLMSKKLLLGVISEDLAKSTGIATRKTNLIYYLLVGTVVALGVKFVGTLLMGALVIIPAATAKNFSRNLGSFQGWATVLGCASAVFGVTYSRCLQIPSGPIVVLTSIFFFTLTYLGKVLHPSH